MFNLYVNSDAVNDKKGVRTNREPIGFHTLPEFAQRHASQVKCDDACVSIEFNHEGILWSLEDSEKV